MSNATLGYDSSFEIASSADSPEDYVSLGEIFRINPPKASVDTVDVTHLSSLNNKREFVTGLVDEGECSIEMNYVPGSAGDMELEALLSIGVGVRRRNCRITYPNGAEITFDAVLTSYEKSIPFDDRMTATVTFKVTGEIAGIADTSPSASFHGQGTMSVNILHVTTFRLAYSNLQGTGSLRVSATVETWHYVTESGLDDYVTEDGLGFYLQESP